MRLRGSSKCCRITGCWFSRRACCTARFVTCGRALRNFGYKNMNQQWIQWAQMSVVEIRHIKIFLFVTETKDLSRSIDNLSGANAIAPRRSRSLSNGLFTLFFLLAIITSYSSFKQRWLVQYQERGFLGVFRRRADSYWASDQSRRRSCRRVSQRSRREALQVGRGHRRSLGDD